MSFHAMIFNIDLFIGCFNEVISAILSDVERWNEFCNTQVRAQGVFRKLDVLAL